MAGVLERQRWGYQNDCCLLFIGLPDSQPFVRAAFQHSLPLFVLISLSCIVKAKRCFKPPPAYRTRFPHRALGTG